jgi:hypothetical protein
MERVTDEEAGEGGWFWNEQVGSFRPPGALYCRECGVLIQGMCLSCVALLYTEIAVALQAHITTDALSFFQIFLLDARSRSYQRL